MSGGKTCGGCQNFHKWPDGGGICDLHDWRTHAGHHKCPDHKAIPYNRNDNKISVKELKDE